MIQRLRCVSVFWGDGIRRQGVNGQRTCDSIGVRLTVGAENRLPSGDPSICQLGTCDLQKKIFFLFLLASHTFIECPI